MNKFRSLTPSSRARRRREEEEAMAEQTSSSKPFQSSYRPKSSHSGRSRQSDYSVVTAGESGEAESNAVPPVVMDRRRPGLISNYSVVTAGETSEAESNAVPPVLMDRRRPGLMSPNR